jgi:alpha-tubulin suppressor-like RCC1 family protein
VTGGGSHTCATRAGGTLWCWGSDYSGQLGIGYHPDQFLPRQVISPVPLGLGQRERRRKSHLRRPRGRRPVVLGRQ